MLLAKLIITVLTAFITLVLLYMNYRTNKISRKAVKEMQSIREEEYRPYVFADIVFKDFEMSMVLRNQGKEAAYNVQLTVDKDFKVWNALVGDKNHHLKDLAIHSDIEMLAPGDEFCEWLDQSGFFFRNNEERWLTGNISYEDSQGKKYSHEVDIDLEPYAQRSQSMRKGFSDLVKSIENMRKIIERNW